MADAPPSIRTGIDFDNHHVVVTGAGTGIGRHIAQEFGAAGAAVTVFDVEATPRDETDPTPTVIERNGGTATFVRGDVADADAVEDGIEAARKEHGEIDVLVNNAGINHLGRVDEVSIEDWDAVLAVNLRGAFLTTRFALPSLRETTGCVVNVASGAGLHGSPRYAAYGPSKAALINLTRQVATDFSAAGIRSNAVAPGIVEAGMAAQELDDPETVDYKRENTLVPRFGHPMDVANAVLFLASDAASFVTGEVLVVDGGWDA